jgi:hypothetical protein
MNNRPDAVVPDLAAEPLAWRVRKLPIPVTVSFARSAGVIETLEGAVWHAPGDAVLTGVQGEKWPVRREVFATSYDPVPPTQSGQDGAYLKRPLDGWALQLRSTITISVGHHDDPLRGHSGDWLLQYSDGSYGVLSDDIFRATYRQV